jgi:hypothetical protein
MNDRDFDELFGQAQQIGKQLARVYREVTGEDLEIESIIRHYPLFAVGLAAGAGALGGYWLGRRGQKQLPPPPPKGSSSIERLRDLNERRKEASDRGESLTPMDFVEHLLPPGMELDDAAQTAKEWVSDRLEPRLREGVDSVLENMADFRFGTFLRQTIRRADQSEDRPIEDPENDGDLNSPDRPDTP